MHLLALVTAGLVFALTPSVASAATNCAKWTCEGHTLKIYPIKKADTCQKLVEPLNFLNQAEIESINNMTVLGRHFDCDHIQKSSAICYPPVKDKTICKPTLKKTGRKHKGR